MARWGEAGKNHLLASEKLKGADVEPLFFDEILSAETMPPDRGFEIAGVFMDSPVSAAVIDGLPDLKFITTLSTGFDHIDLQAAAAKGIPVSSVPAYGEVTVAEFAFALILALSRKIPASRDRVRVEKKFTTDGLTGFDLAGKTLGVVGAGRIGKHAVTMGRGFGMNVIAFDVIHDDAFAAQTGMSYVSLEELLAKSDVITIHCPYMPSTHHLINANNIGLVKKGAYLVNTARGAVVETPALLGALKSGQLAGAGLDVIEGEEDMKKGNLGALEEFLAMPNVIVTPHNAFNTNEAFVRILDTTIDNIVAYLQGSPINVVK